MQEETEIRNPKSQPSEKNIPKEMDLSALLESKTEKKEEPITEKISDFNMEETQKPESIHTLSVEDKDSKRQETFNDFSKQKSQEIDDQINQEFAEDNESWKDVKEENDHENVNFIETKMEYEEIENQIEKDQDLENSSPFDKKTNEESDKREEKHEFDILKTENAFQSKKPKDRVSKSIQKNPFNTNGLINEKMQNYNGLKDNHLQGFFYSDKRKIILIKNGLITPDGYLINKPEEYLKKKDMYLKTNLIEKVNEGPRKNSVSKNPYVSRQSVSKKPILRITNLSKKNIKIDFHKNAALNGVKFIPETKKIIKSKLNCENRDANRLPILAQAVKKIEKKSDSKLNSQNSGLEKIKIPSLRETLVEKTSVQNISVGQTISKNEQKSIHSQSLSQKNEVISSLKNIAVSGELNQKTNSEKTDKHTKTENEDFDDLNVQNENNVLAEVSA